MRARADDLVGLAGSATEGVTGREYLEKRPLLPSGELVDRHYSIASNPARRDVYEIAVLREEEGSGGSSAVHDNYRIGTRLRIDMPGNHFGLHDDDRPALLIAGGIGITPIKPMAQALEARGADFQLHYAGRSRGEMAFRDRLERQLGNRLRIYCGADSERLDIAETLVATPDDAVIYVCGPTRLVGAVKDTAQVLGIPRERVRLELFA